jgi:hypothetical protein
MKHDLSGAIPIADHGPSLSSVWDDPQVLAVGHLIMGVSDFTKSEER